MKTNKKGISLIVLIITILVMIIIAAAVILYLDDSKVVKNAKKAATSNNVSVAKEVVTVARAEWRTNKDKILDEGYKTFRAYAENKLKEAGFEIGTNGGQVEVKENGLLYVYMEPVIPEGFVASNVSTEDEVSEGLVIYEGYETVTEDNVEEAQTTRNQFVWVPVPSMSEFVRKDWGKGDPISETTSYDLDSAEEAAEYTAMKESVAKHGGFYIARYEAGIEDNTYGTFVSKKNIPVYGNTSWSRAKTLCSTLSTDFVDVHLVYGEEWDAALNFISKTDATYAIDSTGEGHYTGTGYSGRKTGTDIDDNKSNMKNNIYDMAGNRREWTMEKDNTEDIRVERGGSDTVDGAECPASYRDRNWEINSSRIDTFRSALYIK